MDTTRAASEEVVGNTHTKYKDAKKKLKLMIIQAKESKWKEVVDALDQNVWGQAYKHKETEREPAYPHRLETKTGT